MNFFKELMTKTFAKQLRKPNGFFANKVGNKMNEANKVLYELTLDTMQLQDNSCILEIGFGNGKFFDHIFTQAKNLQIYGLDFSADMVKAATGNNPQSISSGKLVLQGGNSNSIPFDSNSFDKVFCINVIYFWEQPELHLQEIYRVLKPGGRFYTSIRSKESMQQMPFVKHGFTTYSEAEWKNKAEATGFRYLQTGKISEQGTLLNGKSYNLESMCLVFEKPR